MKKTIAFIIALILFLISSAGISAYNKEIIKRNAAKYIYGNSDTRNSNAMAMSEVFRYGIPVLGSSELSAEDDIAYPPALFHSGNSDFNMILIGRGNIQSLLHTINLGAMEDSVENRKVVLILSPQWFEQPYASEAFPSRFSERNYAKFLNNTEIPSSLKTEVSNRVVESMTADPIGLDKVKLYNDVHLGKSLNPVKQLQLKVYDDFMNKKSDFEFQKEVKLFKTPQGERVKVEDIDFEAVLVDAEQAGNEACTNNDLFIYDHYYDTYVKSEYESGVSQNSRISGTMDPSINKTAEYNDFQLFLNVCKAVGIEPLIVNVPVHGRWYDWTGFPQAERDYYYQTISDICYEYGVELADFSGKEYEEYFLKDIMHLGWKGWVYVDEAVYNFYKK